MMIGWVADPDIQMGGGGKGVGGGAVILTQSWEAEGDAEFLKNFFPPSGLSLV